MASHHWDGRGRERKEGISQLASRLYLNWELNLERETGRKSKTKEGKKGSKSKGRREGIEKKRRTGGNPQAATD